MNPPNGQDLADYLGLPTVDPQCDLSMAAIVETIEGLRWRSDPVLLWTKARMNKGALLWAAIDYQSKAAPTGLPEYDEVQATYGNSMSEIYRLIGGGTPDPAVA